MSVSSAANEMEGINLSDFPDLDAVAQHFDIQGGTTDPAEEVIDITDFTVPVDHEENYEHPSDIQGVQDFKGQGVSNLDDSSSSDEFQQYEDDTQSLEPEFLQSEQVEKKPKKGNLFKWIMNICLVLLLAAAGVVGYALFIAEPQQVASTLPPQPAPAPAPAPEPVAEVDPTALEDGLVSEDGDLEAEAPNDVTNQQSDNAPIAPATAEAQSSPAQVANVEATQVANAVPPAATTVPEVSKSLLDEQNRKISDLSNRLTAVEEMLAKINKQLAADNEILMKQISAGAVAANQPVTSTPPAKPVVVAAAQPQPKVVAKDPALEKLKAEVARDEVKATPVVLKPITQAAGNETPKQTSQVATGKLKRSNPTQHDQVDRDQLALTTNEKLVPEKAPVQAKPQDHPVAATPEKKFSYSLAAVVSGRAHIQNQEGLRSDISYGDVVPGCGKVTRIDPDAGEVATEKCPTFK